MLSESRAGLQETLCGNGDERGKRRGHPDGGLLFLRWRLGRITSVESVDNRITYQAVLILALFFLQASDRIFSETLVCVALMQSLKHDNFGEEMDNERCGNCDNCVHPLKEQIALPDQPRSVASFT